MAIEDTHVEADKLIANYYRSQVQNSSRRSVHEAGMMPTAGHTRPEVEGIEVVIQGDGEGSVGERAAVPTAGHTRPGGEGIEVVIQGDGEGSVDERAAVPTAGHTRPGGEGIEVVIQGDGEGSVDERAAVPTADHTRPGGEGIEVVIQGDGEGSVGERTAGHIRPGEEGIEVARNESTHPMTSTHMPTAVTCTVRAEFRDIDLRAVGKVDEFCRSGCGCSMGCSAFFSQKHYLEIRSNFQQLERKELDMVLMGQMMAFTFCSQIPENSIKYRHQLKQRERNTSSFYHNGLRVCKKTFLFLHDIGDFRLRAIRAHYVTEGLVPRIHGHAGRTAPNALVLGEVKGIITFVMQYVESNAILLPGRIPGYKRDDIKLLPSSCTKRAVWVLYQESAASLSLRAVAYTTFCKVWRNFLADVVVCKPMTDLCETCQRNSAAIVRSSNMPEEEKSEVSGICTCTCTCVPVP